MIARSAPAVSSTSNLERWFADNVLPHEADLRNWLSGRFPSLTNADIIVREAYVRVLRAQAVAPLDSPKAFLFTTARNLARESFRHKGGDARVRIAPPRVDPPRPIYDRSGCEKELRLLTQAIQALPSGCRRVLTLRKIYGLSQKQTAVELGIPESAVEAQIGDGLCQCAEYLARHGMS